MDPGKGRRPPPFALNKNATEEPATMTSQSHEEPVPLMQKFLDNPFLLLFFGVMVPMLVYTLWGVIEILTVPLAK
jgi:hypothetical protein